VPLSVLESMGVKDALERVNVPSYVIDSARCGLPRRQSELRVRNGLLGDIRDLAEHANDVLAVDEGYRADVD
jgi:hypothetical protein